MSWRASLHQTCWMPLMKHRAGDGHDAVNRIMGIARDFDTYQETSTFWEIPDEGD